MFYFITSFISHNNFLILQVEQVMNGCGHKILVKCGAPLSACNHSCDKLLQCGHKCKGKCSNQCDNGICKESVFITSKACGHKCEIPCHMARQEGGF